MKNLITLFVLIISINTQASHWFTYYVYHEVEYLQGPWSRANLLDDSNYIYLTVEQHESLLGTEDSDLVDTLISKLKEKKPDLYNWTYELKIDKDLVEISTEDEVDFEAIKNELIATILFNNFEKLKFDYNGQSETLTLDDLTLPYFDLVTNPIQTETTDEPLIEQEEITENQPIENKEEKRNTLVFWLMASVLLNIGILGFWLMRKKKKE